MSKIKIIYLASAFFLIMQGISGQTPANLTDSLKLRFSNYVVSVPREEVYIHTDRQDYISGDYCWFTVYLMDRQTLKPSTNSKIVYFELLNSDNRPIIQKKISIHNGSGPGAIVIPDTISTGNYTIRAYTSWMRNFLPENCFQKDLRIYNALNVRKIYRKKIDLTDTQGMKGRNMEPDGKDAGLTLKINDSGKDNLEISVEAETKFIAGSDNLFYIFIQSHGNIDHVSREAISGPLTKVSIPKASLSRGINQITIFNSKGKPVAVKYIYTPAAEESPFTMIAADSCGLRKKLTIQIIPAGQASAASDSAHMSISVAQKTGNTEPSEINDYMLFGSEYGLSFGGDEGSLIMNDLPPDSVERILSNLKSNWIDWPVILSGKVPVYKYQMENEGPVILGKLISGDQKSVNPHKKVFLCIPGKEAEFQYSITDDEGNFSFHIAPGEEHGDFILMPEDNTGKNKIILRSSFSDVYAKSTGVIDSSSGVLDPVISKMSVNHQVQTIYAIYPGISQVNKSAGLIKPQKFYGKPDKELILSDYISLPVMSEVFFELLPGVSMKKKQTGYEISIIEHVNDEINVRIPTLMIDGVIIPDASLIANLDPELVEKIDIVKARYVVGKHIFSGIVNVITKAGDFSCVSLSDNMIRVPYSLTDHVMTFVAPEYPTQEAQESRIPDYRNTYYWNPSVKTGKDGKAEVELWSSDNKGNYLIDIEGIASDGKSFSLRKVIRVR